MGTEGTLVNATTLGRDPSDLMTVPPGALEGMVLLDLNYDPQWRWRSRAAESALRTVTGEVMLVYQAAESFRIWTGRNPDAGAAMIRVRQAMESDDSERSRGK